LKEKRFPSLILLTLLLTSIGAPLITVGAGGYVTGSGDGPEGSLTLSLSLSKSTLKRLELQTATATFLSDGEPVEEAKVTFYVEDPFGEAFALNTILTGSDGRASYTFRLPEDAPAPGTYTVYATAWKAGVGNATAEPQSFTVPLFLIQYVHLSTETLVRESTALTISAVVRATWNLTQTAHSVLLYFHPPIPRFDYPIPMELNESTGEWFYTWTPHASDPVGHWSLWIEAVDAYGYSQLSAPYNFTVENYEPRIDSVRVNGVPVVKNQTVYAYPGENLTFGVGVVDLDAEPGELNVTLWSLVDGTPTLLDVFPYDASTGLFQGWMVAEEDTTLLIRATNGHGAYDEWFLFLNIQNRPPQFHWVTVEPASFDEVPTTVHITANVSDAEDGYDLLVGYSILWPNGTVDSGHMAFNSSTHLFEFEYTVPAGAPMGGYEVVLNATDSAGAVSEYYTAFSYRILAPIISDPLVNGTVVFDWTLVVPEHLVFSVNVTDHDTDYTELEVSLIFRAPNGSDILLGAMEVLQHWSGTNTTRFAATFTASPAYILPPDQRWRVYVKAVDADENSVTFYIGTVRVLNTPPTIHEPPSYMPTALYRVRESLSVSVSVTDVESGSNLNVVLYLKSPSGMVTSKVMTYSPSEDIWTASWTPGATAEASRTDFWRFWINATDEHGSSAVSDEYLFVVLNNDPQIVSFRVMVDGKLTPLELYRMNNTLTLRATVYDVEALAVEDPSSMLRVSVTLTSDVHEFSYILPYNTTTGEGLVFLKETLVPNDVPYGEYTVKFKVEDLGVTPPAEVEMTYPLKLKVLNRRPEIRSILINGMTYGRIDDPQNVSITANVSDWETPTANLTVTCLVKFVNATYYHVYMEENMTFQPATGLFNATFELKDEYPTGAYLIIVTVWDYDALLYKTETGVAFRAAHFDYRSYTLGIKDLRVVTTGVGRGNQTIEITARVLYYNGTAWVPLTEDEAVAQNITVTANLMPSWNITIDPVYLMEYNNETGLWEKRVVVPVNATVGEYFAAVSGGGVLSNETYTVLVTNYEPKVPAFYAENATYRMQPYNVTAMVVDADNSPSELNVSFVAWAPGSEPFIEPPTLTIPLAFTHNITGSGITWYVFTGAQTLGLDLGVGEYFAVVVVSDLDMAGFPDEYGKSANMTLTILDVPPVILSSTLSGGKTPQLFREGDALSVSGQVSDFEDFLKPEQLTVNVTVTGPDFRLSREKKATFYGYFTFDDLVEMAAGMGSGNYTVVITVRDSDGGSARVLKWFALNRPATITEVAAYPASIYRVTQSVTVSAAVVNDLDWETPDVVEVYLNLMKPSGEWVNDTYAMTWNGTYFVWTSDFEGEDTGTYTAVVRVTDLYGEVTESTPVSFEVMNNPPTVTAITIEARTVKVGGTLSGSVSASDVEGGVSVEVCFQGPDGWHNVTAQPEGGAYAFSTSTEGWAPGDYAVYAVATDGDGATTLYQDPEGVTLKKPLPMMLILGAVGAVVILVLLIAVLLLRRGAT